MSQLPNTYTLISSNVLGSSAASVTFSAIPSTYTDLVLRGNTRDDIASVNGIFKVIYNGDSGSNYSSTQVRGTGSAADTTRNSNATFIYGALLNGNTTTSNTFSPFEFYIPSYTASTNKPSSVDAAQESNTTSPIYRTASANLWRSTAAITSITFNPNGSNFLAGSSFYLYGIKNS